MDVGARVHIQAKQTKPLATTLMFYVAQAGAPPKKRQ